MNDADYFLIAGTIWFLIGSVVLWFNLAAGIAFGVLAGLCGYGAAAITAVTRLDS